MSTYLARFAWLKEQEIERRMDLLPEIVSYLNADEMFKDLTLDVKLEVLLDALMIRELE